MKPIASLRRAFWKRYNHYALFRRLRPRLMTMILTLVLPVSLTCMAVSVISAVQGRNLIQASSQSSFELYMNQVALRCACEKADLQADFPGLPADELPGLARTVADFGGALYFSRDGREAWRMEADGSVAAAAEDFEALAGRKHTFLWQNSDVPLLALAAIPTGTAPYTVIFYDFEGNEIDRCGLDETHLYNDMKTLTGIGGGDAVYNLDTDPENSQFSGSYDAEQAVVVLSLVDPEDDTATLELKVNGKYDDLVVLYVEGTYSMNEEQTEITLTPDDDSNPGATLTLNEDGTYTYVSTDGDEVTLVEVKEAEVAYQLKGAIPVPGMDGMNADLICDLYDDGTAVIYADFMGNRMDIDQGTYEIDMTTYSFVLHLDTAGDLTTEGYAADMVLNYKADDVAPFGAIEQTLAFVAE